MDRIFNLMLDHGHAVQHVINADGPSAAYTVGRTLKGRPEFIISGPFPPELGVELLNAACHLDDACAIEPNTPVQGIVDGRDAFAIEVDPKAAEMYVALAHFGRCEAIQLLWPDDTGAFPGDPDCSLTEGLQMVYPKVASRMNLLVPYAPTNVVAEILKEPGVIVEVGDYADGLGVLMSHAGGIPLAPGDIVTHDGTNVTGLRKQANVWLFEVVINQPQMILAADLSDPDSWDVRGLDDDEWATAKLAADEVEKELAQMVPVWRGTNFSITLATESREWFDNYVNTCPHVWMYLVMREPGQHIDLTKELAQTALDQPAFDRNGEPLP